MKSSMSSIVNSRQFLRTYIFAVVLAALVPLFCLAISRPVLAGEALYSAIVIDLEPIKATGLGDFANPIGAAVKRALNKTYAGSIDAKNKSLPVLVVEIATIYYGQEEEKFISNRIFPMLMQTRDQMSGTAVVRKAKSELKRKSILGTSVKQGGWPPINDVKSGRLDALAIQFADTVRDELGD